MQEWKAVASAEDAFWTPPPPPKYARAAAQAAAVQCPWLVCPAHSCYRRPERNPSRVQPSGRAQGPLKSALPLRRACSRLAGAPADRVGGLHTEYSEKVGKRGSMPKLIAQRPAIGSWTWSRDCVYWCRLAGPKGLADGHPPTTYCYVVCSRWLGSSKAEENDGHRRHRPAAAAAAANAAPVWSLS